MAGVAGPMLRTHRGSGTRFLTGLLVGGVAAGVVLAVPAYLAGRLAQQAAPLQVRLWLLAAVCALFAVADLANRTPHVWRQVPQRLVYVLPPGMLGMTWGFDLGLLVTTQKVVSLVWVAIAAVVLLDPAMAGGALVVMAVAAGLGIAAWTTIDNIRTRPQNPWGRQWQRQIRRASGATMLLLVALTLVQAAQV